MSEIIISEFADCEEEVEFIRDYVAHANDEIETLKEENAQLKLDVWELAKSLKTAGAKIHAKLVIGDKHSDASIHSDLANKHLKDQ